MQIRSQTEKRIEAVYVPGVFDGPTKGHVSLLERARLNGQRLGLPVAAHIYEADAENKLCSKEELLECFAKMGVEYALLQETPLDRKAYMIPQGSYLACGENIAGQFENVDTERVIPLALKVENGVPVSSNLAHEALEAHDFETLNALLPFGYVLSGQIVHGQHVGSTRLGVPTANLERQQKALPPFGVYYGRVETQDGRAWRSVINIGMRPSVTDSPEVTIEAHLIGMEGEDLYGQQMKILLRSYIRDVVRFPSLEALSAQLHKDIDSVRDYPLE